MQTGFPILGHELFRLEQALTRIFHDHGTDPAGPDEGLARAAPPLAHEIGLNPIIYWYGVSFAEPARGQERHSAAPVDRFVV